MLFLIFAVVTKNSYHEVQSISVTLIETPKTALQSSENIQSENNPKSSETLTKAKTENIAKERVTEKNAIEKQKLENERLLQERLAALQAKKRILEKAQKSEERGHGAIQGVSSAQVSQTYLSLISSLIRQNWNIPETIPKNLEAIVLIRILPDGQIIIEGFEQKSGNAIFDASIIRAIKNSSPLPSPKNEIKIGLRFKP
ncbi:cell envelope integrity protein TolA [Thermodesulfovibrio hydrogeniphilus]